jgi:hypothetical protein
MLLDLVDVFASGPLSGNPLAVVRGGEALDTPAMLALTQWLGFSETTFLCRQPIPVPIIACAFSIRPGNCHSPAIPRWAARRPG